MTHRVLHLSRVRQEKSHMARCLEVATRAPLAPTSPRVRGEVDLRAERLRSEANRVRGLVDKLRLAETPPPPDSFPPPRSASLRSESDLSPHAGRGGASGFASHFKIPTQMRLSSRLRQEKSHMARCLEVATRAPLAPTSPRVRGEVDLRAEPLRSEANRVRGLVDKLRLAETPPHPDSFAPLRCARNPTSPRTRGEVAQ